MESITLKVLEQRSADAIKSGSTAPPEHQEYWRGRRAAYAELMLAIYNETAFTGQWRIDGSILRCGTLRIACFDFDTDPSEEFKQAVYRQMLERLNSEPAIHATPRITDSPIYPAIRSKEGVWMADPDRCISVARMIAIDAIISLKIDPSDYKTRDRVIVGISRRLNGTLDTAAGIVDDAPEIPEPDLDTIARSLDDIEHGRYRPVESVVERLQEDLATLFSRRSNCYADTKDESVVLAMDQEKFIAVVEELIRFKKIDLSMPDDEHLSLKRRLIKAEEKLQESHEAIRRHRDYRGDDRCWMDDEALYAALPEGYTAPERDTAVELDRCRQFIACRHNPATQYISPQRRIDELEHQIGDIRTILRDIVVTGGENRGIILKHSHKGLSEALLAMWDLTENQCTDQSRAEV